MEKRILRNRAKCLVCGEILESKCRHDFKTCNCGNLSVDGGKDYIRRCVKNVDKFEELTEFLEVSKMNNQDVSIVERNGNIEPKNLLLLDAELPDILVICCDEKYVPRKATSGAACYDCFVRITDAVEVVDENGLRKEISVKGSPVVLPQNFRVKIPLGFKVVCKQGFRIQLYPRSSTPYKKGLLFVTSGVVDTDFRGEVMAAVKVDFPTTIISDGDKLFQMELFPPCATINVKFVVDKVLFERVEEVFATDRPSEGYGSTGVN